MKSNSLVIVFVICVGFACKSTETINNKSSRTEPINNSADTLSESESTRKPSSCIGTKKTEDVEKALSDEGFNFKPVAAAGTLREAISVVDGEEIKVVLIYGAENSLEDVRVQTVHQMTDRKRKSIQKVASTILTGIQCGDLPDAFLTKFRKGMHIGSNDRVFNDFVYMTALQKPSGSAETDRISLDISFEENPKL